MEGCNKPVGKPAWRARLLAARVALVPVVRDVEAAALASWVSTLRGTVCAYHPAGTEPGSPLMLSALVGAGCTVLLPVVVRGAGGVLDWARYTAPSELAPGAFGLMEPSGPRLGPGAVSTASTVLVPALAVDARGTRLGRGGGYYDRSLPLAAPTARLIAVVRDDELVPRLPRDPHDVPMTAALTPTRGFTPLPGMSAVSGR